MANEDAISLALQLAYEYENPGWEHIEDMLACYEDEDPPCDGDDLNDLMTQGLKLKAEGKTFQEAHKELCKA